jgi:hypothetical protein
MRDVLFYGLAVGVIFGLLVRVIWFKFEFHDAERQMLNAGVPASWLASPKSRAAILDPNAFAIGLNYDAVFWPLAGTTLTWLAKRPRPIRTSRLRTTWCLCVTTLGVVMVVRMSAEYRSRMALEVSRAVKSVADWNKWQLEEEKSLKSFTSAKDRGSYVEVPNDAAAGPPKSEPAPTTPADGHP